MKKGLTIAGIIFLAAVTAYPVFAHGPNRDSTRTGLNNPYMGTGYHMMADYGQRHQRFQHMNNADYCFNDPGETMRPGRMEMRQRFRNMHRF